MVGQPQKTFNIQRPRLHRTAEMGRTRRRGGFIGGKGLGGGWAIWARFSAWPLKRLKAEPMQLKMEIRDKRRGAEEAGRHKGQREGVAIWSHHLVRALKRLKSRAPSAGLRARA